MSLIRLNAGSLIGDEALFARIACRSICRKVLYVSYGHSGDTRTSGKNGGTLRVRGPGFTRDTRFRRLFES